MSDISKRYSRASVPRGFTYVTTTNNLPRLKGHHRRPQSVEPESHNRDYYLGNRLKWTAMPSTDYGAYEDSYVGFSSIGFRPHAHTTRNERIRTVDDAYRGLNRFDPPRLDPVSTVPKKRNYDPIHYEPWTPSTWTYNNYPLGTSYYLSRKRALDLNDEIANLYERDFRNRRYLHNMDTLNDSKYALQKLRGGNLNYYPYLLPSRSGLGRDYVPEVSYQPSTSSFPYTYLRTRPTYFLEPIDWSRFTPKPIELPPNRWLHVPLRVPRGSRRRDRGTSVPAAGYYTIDDGRRARSVSRVRSPVRDVGHNIRTRALLDDAVPNYYHTHGYRSGVQPAEHDFNTPRSTSVPRQTTASPSPRSTRTPSDYQPSSPRKYDTTMPSSSTTPDRSRRGGYEPSSPTTTPSSSSRRNEPTSPTSGGGDQQPYGRTHRRPLDDVEEEKPTGRGRRDVSPPSAPARRQPLVPEETRAAPLQEAPLKSAMKQPKGDDDYISSRRHPTAAGEAETPSPDLLAQSQKPKPTGSDDEGAPTGGDTGAAPASGGDRKPSGAGAGPGKRVSLGPGAAAAAAADEDDDGRPPTRTPPPSAEGSGAGEPEEEEAPPTPPPGMDVDSPFGAAADRRNSKRGSAVPTGHGLLFDPDAEEDNADGGAKPTGDDKAAAPGAGAGAGAGAPGSGGKAGDKDKAGDNNKTPTGAGVGDKKPSAGTGAGASPAGGAKTSSRESEREYRAETREEETTEAKYERKQETKITTENAGAGTASSKDNKDTKAALTKTDSNASSVRGGASKSGTDNKTDSNKEKLSRTTSSGSTRSGAGKKEDDEEQDVRHAQQQEEMIFEEDADESASRRRAAGDYDERAVAKRSKTEAGQVAEKKDFAEEYEYEVRRETTAYEITETWEEQIEHAGYEEIVEAVPADENEGEFVEEETEQDQQPAHAAAVDESTAAKFAAAADEEEEAAAPQEAAEEEQPAAAAPEEETPVEEEPTAAEPAAEEEEPVEEEEYVEEREEEVENVAEEEGEEPAAADEEEE